MSVFLRFPSKPSVSFVEDAGPFGGNKYPGPAALLPPTVVGLATAPTPKAAQWTAPSAEFLCQLTAMTTTAPMRRRGF